MAGSEDNVKKDDGLKLDGLFSSVGLGGGLEREKALAGEGSKVSSSMRVTGSYRREHSIEGLFWGFAVGEALGLGRANLTRRESIRIYGRGPVSYQLVPGVGIVGDRTQRLWIAAQALIRSRSQYEDFEAEFAKRLRWYLLTLPLSGGVGPALASMRLWLSIAPSRSGGKSNSNAALPVRDVIGDDPARYRALGRPLGRQCYPCNPCLFWGHRGLQANGKSVPAKPWLQAMRRSIPAKLFRRYWKTRKTNP